MLYGSGLGSPRAIVRLVSGKQDTFVSLPQEVADAVRQTAGTSSGILPLELVELQPPCNRHLVPFAGQISNSSKGGGGGVELEISQQYAQAIGIRDGTWVRV